MTPLESNPGNARNNAATLFDQALALFRGGRPAEAKRIARRILVDQPKHGQALHPIRRTVQTAHSRLAERCGRSHRRVESAVPSAEVLTLFLCFLPAFGVKRGRRRHQSRIELLLWWQANELIKPSRVGLGCFAQFALTHMLPCDISETP